MSETTILNEVSLLMPDGTTGHGAIAFSDDRILAVGEAERVKGAAGSRAKTVALPGAMVLPGICDGHTHMIDGATKLSQVDLRAARSEDEFKERIKAWLNQNVGNSWVLGGRWDDSSWGGGPPTRAWVDPLTPDRPVWLYRYDMHSALANSKALELARITKETPDPAGGRIVRDPATGEPSGLMVEKAMELIETHVPEMNEAQKVRILRQAFDHAQSLGLTAVHDIILNWSEIGVYRAAAEADPEGLTILLRTPLMNLTEFLEARQEDWPARLILYGVKSYTDGTLGSHSAWLRRPYAGSTDNTGVPWVDDLEAFRRLILEAAAMNVPVSLHTIGDAAIGYSLKVFHECIDRNIGSAPLRIEHFQHPAAEDIARMDHPRLVASMQPQQLHYDAAVAEERLGRERAAFSYPIKSLLGLKCTVVFGSDWAVTDLNPFLGVHTAVTRLDVDGRFPHGWLPDQRITVSQALNCYTSSAARATGMAGQTGELRPGLRADLTVIDRDITGIPHQEIPQVETLMTVVRGRIVYENI